MTKPAFADLHRALLPSIVAALLCTASSSASSQNFEAPAIVCRDDQMHYAFLASRHDAPYTPLVVRVTVTKLVGALTTAGLATIDKVVRGNINDKTVYVSFVGECALPIRVGDTGYLAGHVRPREHPWPRVFIEVDGAAGKKPKTRPDP